MDNSNFTAEDAHKISLGQINEEEEEIIYLEVIDLIKKAAKNRQKQISIMVHHYMIGSTRFGGPYEQMLIDKLNKNGFKTQKQDKFAPDYNRYLTINW